MQHSIATVSLSGDLEGKLRAAAAAGFDAVEIFENDLIASPLRPSAVKALLGDLGLYCSLYQPFRDLEGLPEPQRRRAFDRLERKFDVMGELGADRLLVCSSCSPQASGDRERIVADLREAGERAGRRGIVIGYEALAWGRHVHDHRDAWAIVEAVDHPQVGIILDSFHSLARAVPADSIRAIPGHRIVFVQLADAPRMDMDLLQWSRHYRNLPGQGDLPLDAYVAEILRSGYDGPLSLEIFNDRFRSSWSHAVAEDGRRSLHHIEDRARQLLGQETAIPSSRPPSGIEFVEFAVEASDAARLGIMLSRLGFAPAGRHRLKRVTRWRNGAVNFVVNAEERGFAQAYRRAHGPSICAIGVRVADVDAVLRRADALGIARYDEGPRGHAAMPALRGVGGSLVYLVAEDTAERLWAREFDRVGDDEAAPAPSVSGIDHLASVVQSDELLSWKLYWRSLFGLEEPTPQDVIDPSGLVRSQPIESVDRRFRLTINASDARDTLSARFIANGFGAGFQHVALACDDIFATARALHADGTDVLRFPDNYYADLAARFDLEDERLRCMAASGIVYDEDFTGAGYWQLYTRAFDKLFFFEFVQRASGYDGYGAPNAPVRLAVQSRFRQDAPPD